MMTRTEYSKANVSAMGSNPRLRRLVPATNTGIVMGRIEALKANRIQSTRPMGQAERLALAEQPARFAALLARLPAPRLP